LGCNIRGLGCLKGVGVCENGIVSSVNEGYRQIAEEVERLKGNIRSCGAVVTRSGEGKFPSPSSFDSVKTLGNFGQPWGGDVDWRGDECLKEEITFIARGTFSSKGRTRAQHRSGNEFYYNRTGWGIDGFYKKKNSQVFEERGGPKKTRVRAGVNFEIKAGRKTGGCW